MSYSCSAITSINSDPQVAHYDFDELSVMLDWVNNIEESVSLVFVKVNAEEFSLINTAMELVINCFAL